MPPRDATNLSAVWLAGLLSLGAAFARADDQLMLAPEPLRECVVCHGVELVGNRAVDAPRLAGLPGWYLSRQMTAFRRGWRGSHEADFTGMEMRPQATVLEPGQVEEAVRYAASVPVGPAPAATVSGDTARGRELYQPCAACHGTRGEGIEALLAPPLAGQSDWYLITQLEHFRSGARGAMPGDTQGAVMRASAMTLPDAAAVTDVVAYINTFDTASTGQGESTMKTSTITAAALAATLGAGAASADVTRYPLPGSDFPIAQAVEIPAGTTLVYHSGMTPRPANPDAERFSAEFWGDTETQAMSVFSRLEESLKDKGLGFGDVVKMQVFLVGVPEQDGAMDFDGFMNAYRKYFGSDDQPNLPARSAFQVAGLAAPGMLVEVEVVLARPDK